MGQCGLKNFDNKAKSIVGTENNHRFNGIFGKSSTKIKAIEGYASRFGGGHRVS